MPTAPANGIEIAYEIFGAPEGRPLLLIMGLAAQMILWDDDLCAALAARGHRVIRFDNRDVGLSTKCDWAGMPDAAAAMQAALLGERVDAPYTLPDMAADAVGLLDALGIAAAHVVGASMGGMIAQAMVIGHPALVPVEAGLNTAEAVPGAELLVVDGMGHDLPRAVWPSIVDRISALTARA